MKHKTNFNEPIVLTAKEGRTYSCGSMTAIFKADENETSAKYSVSEWWLEPNSEGPGNHQHEENDEIFYVLDGTVSILIGEEWVKADKGTFVRVPANTSHNFCNRTDKKTGLLNFSIPGGFEKKMPSIVKWFENNKI